MIRAALSFIAGAAAGALAVAYIVAPARRHEPEGVYTAQHFTIPTEHMPPGSVIDKMTLHVNRAGEPPYKIESVPRHWLNPDVPDHHLIVKPGGREVYEQ